MVHDEAKDPRDGDDVGENRIDNIDLFRYNGVDASGHTEGYTGRQHQFWVHACAGDLGQIDDWEARGKDRICAYDCHDAS